MKQSITVERRKRISSHSFFNQGKEKENGQKRDTRLPTVKEFLTTTNSTPLSSTKVHRTYPSAISPKNDYHGASADV